MNRDYIHGVKPFRFITHAIIPLVYDDSLSYYEVVAKVVNKLNELIAADNNLAENTRAIVIDWLENSEESKQAIEDAVSDYVSTYAETTEFKELVKATVENMEDLNSIITIAVEGWLEDVEGDSVVTGTIDEYLDRYVKTDDFVERVKEAVNKLTQITAGDVLNIYQRNSFNAISPSSSISAAVLNQQYVGQIVAQMRAKTLDANSGELEFSASSGAVHKIMTFDAYGLHVPAPVLSDNPVSKGYLENKLATLNFGAYYADVVYSDETSTYNTRETFSELYAEYPAVALKYNGKVYYCCDGNNSAMWFVGSERANDGTYNINMFKYTSSNILTHYSWNSRQSGALQVDGSNAMLGILNAGGYRVSNVGEPINNADAVNLNWARQRANERFEVSCSDDHGMIDSIATVAFGTIQTSVANGYNPILRLVPSNVEDTYFDMEYAGYTLSPADGMGRRTASYMFKGRYRSIEYICEVTDSRGTVISATRESKLVARISGSPDAPVCDKGFPELYVAMAAGVEVEFEVKFTGDSLVYRNRANQYSETYVGCAYIGDAQGSEIIMLTVTSQNVVHYTVY